MALNILTDIRHSATLLAAGYGDKMKNSYLLVAAALLAIILGITSVKSETITMRTWYPSPYGSYQRLRASDFMSAKKVVFEPQSTEPPTPSTGTVYYDTGLSCLRVYTESGWVNIEGPSNYLASMSMVEANKITEYANTGTVAQGKTGYYDFAMSQTPGASLFNASLISLPYNASYPYRLRLTTKTSFGKNGYKVKLFGQIKIRTWAGNSVFYRVLTGSSWYQVLITEKYTDPAPTASAVETFQHPPICYGLATYDRNGKALYKKRFSKPNKLTANPLNEIVQMYYFTYGKKPKDEDTGIQDPDRYYQYDVQWLDPSTKNSWCHAKTLTKTRNDAAWNYDHYAAGNGCGTQGGESITEPDAIQSFVNDANLAPAANKYARVPYNDEDMECFVTKNVGPMEATQTVGQVTYYYLMLQAYRNSYAEVRPDSMELRLTDD